MDQYIPCGGGGGGGGRSTKTAGYALDLANGPAGSIAGLSVLQKEKQGHIKV